MDLFHKSGCCCCCCRELVKSVKYQYKKAMLLAPILLGLIFPQEVLVTGHVTQPQTPGWTRKAMPPKLKVSEVGKKYLELVHKILMAQSTEVVSY